MSLDMTQCAQCGLALFPARYFCPRCGGSDWTRRAIHSGTVTESTVVRHRAGEHDAPPIRLATVQLDEGPTIIARLNAPVGDGTAVRLEVGDDRCIVAHAL
ncbi:Zn-ribbon domain-containing OB-fold protein [Burkholderia multivorans]|uniref:Zn-ribbon domain-containing OB-fold protein n=1 Tax=Burkholderia multivorans TaxID=87883 RepID=UPI000D00DABC|nr:OB-fold domain-containing protein [Burkholderia multivorans]MBR7896026.1 OB-fold domain-containing protein [Burkholderia multivorans]MBR8452748.1 OB-fold domain-containing protein [Burkholderia multivorans]MBU9449440.1 OB-fold domain-containing protein [Burkholderia multivorans]MCL4644157.1 OB-fold domain-containing protein [Burkholderia multivorans]PRG33340.1 DNA-binding protein [Burkholderia multivorans]